MNTIKFFVPLLLSLSSPAVYGMEVCREGEPTGMQLRFIRSLERPSRAEEGLQPLTESTRSTLGSWGFSEEDISTISLENPLDPLSDRRFDFARRGFLGLLFRSRHVPHSGRMIHHEVDRRLSQADLLLLMPVLIELGHDPRYVPEAEGQLYVSSLLSYIVSSRIAFPRAVEFLLSSPGRARSDDLNEHRGIVEAAVRIAQEAPSEERTRIVELLSDVSERIEQERAVSEVVHIERARPRPALAVVAVSGGETFIPESVVAPRAPKLPPVFLDKGKQFPGMPAEVLKKYVKDYKYKMAGGLTNNIVKYVLPPAAIFLLYNVFKESLPKSFFGWGFNSSQKKRPASSH